MFGSGKEFPRCVPGRPIRAEPFNRAFGILEALTRMQVEPPLEAVEVGGRMLLRYGGGAVSRIAKVGTGGISGRVGTTPGSGTAKLRKATFTKAGTTTTGTLADDTDATIYNQWLGWISTNAEINVIRRDGQWWVAGPEPMQLAVLTASLNSGSLASPATAGATLYRWNGSTYVTTGQTITVRNTFTLTTALATGKQVHVSEKGDAWTLHTANC